MRTEGMMRKLQAIWRRYNRWMTGAVMVPPIVILTAFFSIYTTVGTGYELGKIVHENAQYPYFISNAVKNMPDDWDRKTWDDYENGLISAYERDVRLGKSEKLRVTTDELAERIWASGKERFWTKMKPFVWKEVCQCLTGKATGRLFSSMHDVLTPEVAAKLPAEYAGEMGEQFLESVRLNDIGEALGKATYAVGLNKMEALGPEDKKEGISELTKQLVELTKGMRQAIYAKPEQALVARFHHIIHCYKNDTRRLTTEQMMEEIKEEIELHGLGELTQEGNDEGSSPGSMWKDKDELAKWLVLQVEKTEPGKERELEKKPDEEPEEEHGDISLPLPFFREGDAERLAPSGKFETYQLVKPELTQGIVDGLAYRGFWGPEKAKSNVAIAIFVCDDLITAQNYYDQMKNELKVNFITQNNKRSKAGCPVPPDSIQDTPNRLRQWLPYTVYEQGGHTFREDGEVEVWRLYRNTMIAIDGESSSQTDDTKMRQFADEMENNAIRIIDQAIERAKGKGWRE
jgi:hypothetical protein